MKLQQALDTKEIGSRVRQLRKARSMKQDDLGMILGDGNKPLSRGQVSNLETGKRNFNIHQIKKVADFFGVSLEALGVKSEELEVNDLLAKARIIFDNNSVPMSDKQELAEEIYKLYIIAKEQIKK